MVHCLAAALLGLWREPGQGVGRGGCWWSCLPGWASASGEGARSTAGSTGNPAASRQATLLLQAHLVALYIQPPAQYITPTN